VIGQRVLAVLLAVLFCGLLLAGFTAVGRALGSPAGGLVTGVGFVLLMVWGWVRQRDGRPR
jgi:hypothetical protein